MIDDLRDYWDERAADLEELVPAAADVVRMALLDAPVQPPRRALAVEIGPGHGRVAAELASWFERVVGIDVSPAMVAGAASVSAANVELIVGDGASLRPVTDASADLVLSFRVFQHLPGALIAAYVREAARVLRPGGVLAAHWNDRPRPRGDTIRAAVTGAGLTLHTVCGEHGFDAWFWAVR